VGERFATFTTRAKVSEFGYNVNAFPAVREVLRQKFFIRTLKMSTCETATRTLFCPETFFKTFSAIAFLRQTTNFIKFKAIGNCCTPVTSRVAWHVQK
jgi:hypothetical protein